MLYPHSIRLRSAWQYAFDAGPWADSRAALPEAWQQVLDLARGRPIRLHRRFNRPTGVEPHESIWLVIDQPRHLEAVRLNKQPLTFASEDSQLVAFDVTPLVIDHNELDLEVQGVATIDAPPWSEIRLEIRLKD